MLPRLDDNVPQTKYYYLSAFARKVLKAIGWQVTGTFPEEKKFILAVAPHTSNWDFIIAMLVVLALNLKVTFLGKKSIFVGPLKWLLEKLGGVGIDREHPHGVVGQMVELFNQREKMVIGLSPEGTRSKTKEWKKGFLYIAQQANVPVVPISLDFRKKEISILAPEVISEDIDDALKHIKSLFNDVCAKNPHLV